LPMALADIDQGVVGCHSSQDTLVQMSVDDVASNI
jgi:hypothetical protein